MLAHLIFHVDISQGADCASERQCSCKWEWVKKWSGGGVSTAVVVGGALKKKKKTTGLFILPDMLLSFECAAALRKAP